MDWRLEVLTRDNFTCVACGQVGGQLHAHHIIPFFRYKMSRFSVHNGSTLCFGCHSKVHGHNIGAKAVS